MIHFNVPPFTGKEFEYMHEAVNNHKICGDGPFTKKCDEWMEKRFNARKVMLTTSGSSALDMAALLSSRLSISDHDSSGAGFSNPSIFCFICFENLSVMISCGFYYVYNFQFVLLRCFLP